MTVSSANLNTVGALPFVSGRVSSIYAASCAKAILWLLYLHLPTESHDEHFQSLYFLKKTFTSQSEVNGHGDTDIVKVHEYCPNCIALWKDDNERTCRFCGEQRKGRPIITSWRWTNGAQLKSMFEGTA